MWATPPDLMPGRPHATKRMDGISVVGYIIVCYILFRAILLGEHAIVKRVCYQLMLRLLCTKCYL